MQLDAARTQTPPLRPNLGSVLDCPFPWQWGGARQAEGRAAQQAGRWTEHLPRTYCWPRSRDGGPTSP